MTQVIVFFCISNQWACCATFSYLARAYCSSCSLFQKPCTFPSSNCIDLLWGNVIYVIYGGYFICYMCSRSSIFYMLTAACLWIYWFTGSSKPQYSTKKSHHLDLTKQLDKSLPLDNYCMGNYVSAGNKLFTLTQWIASHFSNNHVGRHIMWSWKDVNLFQKGQIIGMRQAKKTSKETAETT